MTNRLVVRGLFSRGGGGAGGVSVRPWTETDVATTGSPLHSYRDEQSEGLNVEALDWCLERRPPLRSM